jgi:FixJ family two-component response regulator
VELFAGGEAFLDAYRPRREGCLLVDVKDLVLAGYASKNIAADLGISQRTVDNHRAHIMRKTGSKSLPALIRMALAAS